MGNLQTLRTNLVPLTLEHLSDKYINWLNDTEVNQFLEVRHLTQTRDTIKNFILENMGKEDRHLYAIILKNNNEHIGNVKIGPIHKVYQHADLSYFIGEKKYWGQGFTTEVLTEVCHFAFKKLNLHRLNAGYYENNLASAKILKKLGFCIEGEIKEKLLFGNKRIAHILCGLLKKNWS